MLGIETSLLKDFSLFGWGKGDTVRAKEETRLEPQLGTPSGQSQQPQLQNAVAQACQAVDVRLSSAATAASPIQQNDLLMLPAPSERPNVRNMTPRELADFAYNHYMDGNLSWEEYRMVGFPSELHPDYDKTIGQLTGEAAQPDKPKDMVTAWKQRVEFEQKYSGEKPEVIERAQRILDLLRWEDAPPSPVKLEI